MSEDGQWDWSSLGKESGALQHGIRDYLQGPCKSGELLVYKAETIAARDAVILLRKRATKIRALVPILWFSELDLDFSVSDPAEIAAAIDQVLDVASADTNSHVVVGLWKLAARAYHLAKKDEDKYRCQSEAAERFVAEAITDLTGSNSAMCRPQVKFRDRATAWHSGQKG